MDCSKTGLLISRLRKQKGLTQRGLADMLGISDKTVSKWERGLGCPDVSLLAEVSAALGVNIEGMLSGELKKSPAVNGNMKRTLFFVCPDCKNVITAAGIAAVCCCGNVLEPLAPKAADEIHCARAGKVEDEWFISFPHSMEKTHYISFAALITGDRMFFAKLYPEGNAEVRFKRSGRAALVFYCTRHGLFRQEL